MMFRVQRLLSRARYATASIHDQSRQCFVVLNKNGLAEVMLNRPERKNAFGRQLVGELQEAIAFLNSSPDVRVTLFRSAVNRCFSAGADLKERAEMSVSEAEAFVDSLRATFHQISTLPTPTLAALDGVALGGGLELALACDLRYAGQDSRLGLPETRLAILPAAGGSQRLPRLIGQARAKELIFTARILSSTEAHAYGLVNGVGPSGIDLTRAAADEMLCNGPLALRQAKAAIERGLTQSSMTEALAVEKECYARLLASADRLEGLAAFREGRTPNYRGQ